MKNNSSSSDNNYNLAIIAIVAALAVLGIVVVMVAVTIPLQQQAEAAPGGVHGCPTGTPAGNASKVRCIHP